MFLVSDTVVAVLPNISALVALMLVGALLGGGRLFCIVEPSSARRHNPVFHEQPLGLWVLGKVQGKNF